MTKAQMTELVSLIAEHVYGDTGNVSLGSTPGCEPVKLQIGFTNNIVQHDGIIITDAPSSVTEAVMDWAAKKKVEDQTSLVKASAGYGGLFIR